MTNTSGEGARRHGEALARIAVELKAVATLAATEAGRRAGADWSVSAGDPHRSGPGHRVSVTLSSLRGRTDVAFAVSAREVDGDIEASIVEVGSAVAFPLGRLGVDDGALQRVLRRLRAADHWIALHLRDRLDEAEDAVRNRDAFHLRDEVRKPLGEMPLRLRLAVGAAAVMGAYVLAGLLE